MDEEKRAMAELAPPIPAPASVTSSVPQSAPADRVRRGKDRRIELTALPAPSPN